MIDGTWSLLGSANWDPRSRWVSFELNVECYNRPLAEQLGEIIAGKLKEAKPLTLTDTDSQATPVKLRDSIARLFSPYL